MDSTLSAVLIGVPVGVVGSYISWWILFHYFVPNVSFSGSISKVSTDTGVAYRVKMINSGRRDIVDATVFIRMYVQIDAAHPHNENIIELEPRINSYPLLLKKGKPKLIVISPGDNKKYVDEVFPEVIRSKARSSSLTLDDLLNIGSNSRFHIIVFGYDEFSGTRKAFESKYYKAGDIQNYMFKRGWSFELAC